ncbi:MAG: hypothetical protein ABIQ31_19670 [Ferruginibacter sp.]
MTSEQRKTVFPFGWILLVLVAMAFLACYLYFQRYQGEREINLHSVYAKLIDKRENDSTVNAYIRFVEQSSGTMSLDHAYSNEALLRLSAAVNAMAKAVDYTVKANVDEAELDANKIILDPLAVSHADNIRNAADILSTALSNLQREKYPSLSVAAETVRKAASKIDPDVLTLDQKNNVKIFFNKRLNYSKK